MTEEKAVTSTTEEKAIKEYDALGLLGEAITEIPDLSSLTIAMINQHIAGIQDTLRMVWGIPDKQEADSESAVSESNRETDFFTFDFTYKDLQTNSGFVEMQIRSGEWVGVNLSNIEKVEPGMTIRIKDTQADNDFFYYNGKCEFTLAETIVVKETKQSFRIVVIYFV